MKETVWYISKYATPLKYGFASRHFYLAREFNRLGYRTVVISSDSNHLAKVPEFDSRFTHECIDGIDTWWIRTLRYEGSGSIRRMLSWLDFEMGLLLMPKQGLPRPDVVIASSLSLFTVLSGYWLKRRFGCKLIFEVRDIWPLTIIEEGGFNPRNPAVRVLAWVEKFGYLHADVIVGTMPNLAEHVRSVCATTAECHCVPFGYDPELYDKPQPLPEGYADRYIPKGKFIVGYAGSIGITNALEPLLGCARAMEADDRVHFLLLGEGGLLEDYKRQTADLKNVTFAPRVDRTQVQSVLEHCQVLYFSVKDSKVWRYGMSLNKLIDYMLSAKPIVASYSGYPSMVNEADCGVFVPADDVAALVTAIGEMQEKTDEERAVIGKRGKDWLIENRPYAMVAREYTTLF
jgi:glycosyltransferase involved in cell wall biosynthesis